MGKGYQSNHLWNWNSNVSSGWNSNFFLSIEPSLELKHQFIKRIIHYTFPINRTISGIETSVLINTKLWAISYQSNHLWNWNSWIHFSPRAVKYYQSNHLWNWNLRLRNQTAWIPYLSIEPSLELKLNKPRCESNRQFSINRTISGIETQLETLG